MDLSWSADGSLVIKTVADLQLIEPMGDDEIDIINGGEITSVFSVQFGDAVDSVPTISNNKFTLRPSEPPDGTKFLQRFASYANNMEVLGGKVFNVGDVYNRFEIDVGPDSLSRSQDDELAKNYSVAVAKTTDMADEMIVDAKHRNQSHLIPDITAAKEKMLVELERVAIECITLSMKDCLRNARREPNQADVLKSHYQKFIKAQECHVGPPTYEASLIRQCVVDAVSDVLLKDYDSAVRNKDTDKGGDEPKQVVKERLSQLKESNAVDIEDVHQMLDDAKTKMDVKVNAKQRNDINEIQHNKDFFDIGFNTKNEALMRARTPKSGDGQDLSSQKQFSFRDAYQQNTKSAPIWKKPWSNSKARDKQIGGGR